MVSHKRRFDAKGTLNALLGPEGASELTSRDQLRLVPLAQLIPTPHQPRSSFTPESLAELADSIRENGVLQPILIRPQGEGFEIVAGERRWRAAQLAGLGTIPAYIRDLNDEQAAAASAVENLIREDLNPVEEVEAKRRIAALTLGVADEEVMTRLRRLLDHPEEDPQGIANLNHAFGRLGGEKWESFVRNKGRILNLPEDVREAIKSGLDYRKGLLIGSVASAKERGKLLKLAAAGETVQQLRTRLKPAQAQPDQRWKEIAQRLGKKKWSDGLSAQEQARVDQLLDELQTLLAKTE